MPTTLVHAVPARPPAQTLAEHVRRTLALAVPVMLSRWGLLIMVTVAHAMTGHASADEQAYFAAGFSPQMVVMVLGIGLMMGVTVLSAQADGADQPERCGRIWKMGLVTAAVLSVICVAVMAFGEGILRLIGQTPAVAAGGGRVLWAFAFGMPAILMFVCTSSFLESIGHVRPGMVVTLAANGINVALCWMLVFGRFGLPAMGAVGAAVAISITRWAMLLGLILYVVRMRDGERYGVRAAPGGSMATMLKLLRIGAPLALAQTLESTAFFTTTNIAGWLGNATLAAFYSALNLNANVFMLGIGLATATSVRVANAVGRQDQPGIRRAGWTGAGLTIVMTGAVGLLISLSRQPIAWFYSDDPTVRALTMTALGVVAWLCIADALQAVLIGATRGVADVAVPTVTQGIAFWGIAVPLAYYLGYASAHGIVGLYWGLGASVVAASLFLALRFQALTRRVIRPV
jgi:MATE family multidrug resistance protein